MTSVLKALLHCLDVFLTVYIALENLEGFQPKLLAYCCHAVDRGVLEQAFIHDHVLVQVRKGLFLKSVPRKGGLINEHNSSIFVFGLDDLILERVEELSLLEHRPVGTTLAKTNALLLNPAPTELLE